MWAECKKQGKDSAFWKENKCGGRAEKKAEKYSKYWWWTESGRAMWRECEKKGKDSAFWKENKCEDARWGCEGDTGV